MSYTEEQIRDAFARHAHQDDWGIPCFYLDGLIAALEGEYDQQVAEWRIDISGALDAKGKVPLSLNYRMHWAAQANAVAKVKAVTRNAVMEAEVPHLDHVHVEMHYRPATNRFRDVDNTVATQKPAIDALHQPDTSKNNPVPYVPIVDGDDPRYVTWTPPVLHPWVKGQPAALWLILRATTQTREDTAA